MAKRTVVAMPGDGIGKVVLPEALRVLDAVGFEADYVHGDIGWDFWMQGGQRPARPDDRAARAAQARRSSARSPPSRRTRPTPSSRPRCRARGSSTSARSSGMRQHFDLDICIRPCQLLPGQPAQLHPPRHGRRLRGAEGRRGHLPPEHRGPLLRRRVDQPARGQVRNALETHPQVQGLHARSRARTWRSRCASSPAAPASGSARRRSSTPKQLRLQVGHRLREAERDPRDLGHDARPRPRRSQKELSPASRSGTPTSTPR